ncbi:DNA replication/repair protein RecF [Thiobaca trueperi]|uniref:DNA replication and repair protein RecF n=1 Tax=Thiobaca trueperi TaxID=127458 RepID=A0A4R3MSR7_9GAMM|nr:DNA replication and repair protein RecF [Thiobaca trueperi]TCT19025.1 DNA replication and repair protein RecF [Thiobaca trueperi]
MESAIEDGKLQGLVSLRIENLRNIQRMQIDLDAPVVILSGGNGAGKTTVLEAIYLLARGRSFRGRKAGPITTNGECCTSIKGFCTGQRGKLSLGFYRDRTGTQRSLDSAPWENQDATHFPISVKLIGENAQSLLDGDPALRRTYLDWNVFHVEHRFGRLRKNFHRTLSQRNAVLRSKDWADGIWSRSFVELAEEVNRYREQFFTDWRVQFLQLCPTFDFLADCDIRFRRGWSDRDSLGDALTQVRAAEVSCGYTLIGPSRADFTVERDGKAACFSRGQAKALVCLLQLAADRVHAEHGVGASVWLLDDLEAELDQDTCSKIWSIFAATEAQRFVTRVSTRPMADEWTAGGKACLFHVEHGVLTP